MPSPVGHAVAGLIVGLAGERFGARRTGAGDVARGFPGPSNVGGSRAVPWTFFLTCILLAAWPDLDYIYPPSHRGPTHSLTVTVLITLAAVAVTRWTTGRTRWNIAAIFGLAHLSHIVMDWLGEDITLTPGVKVLWPFSDRLFHSGLDLFRSTMRFEPFVQPQFAHNFWTLVQELAILGPFVIWLLWRRARAASR